MEKSRKIDLKKIVFLALVTGLLLLQSMTIFAASKKPTKITLNKKKLTLEVGDTYSLKATIKPNSKKVDRKVTWKSSNKKIATVSKKGKVKAKSAGTVKITATTVNGKKAVCKIKVKKPKAVIAVVDSYKGSDCQNLITAIEACGAIPVLVTSTGFDVTDFDGLMVPGGNDIDPSVYGQTNQGSVSVNIKKDRMQLAVIKKFVKAKKPVFGICRGMQLINVYFGGTLTQDILNHRGDNRIITIKKKSYLYKTYGKTESVYHTHHQACAKMGKNLVVTMKDKIDKTIEGYEHKTLKVYGVQWHPELMGTRGYKTIKLFVNTCEQERDAAEAAEKEQEATEAQSEIPVPETEQTAETETPETTAPEAETELPNETK